MGRQAALREFPARATTPFGRLSQSLRLQNGEVFAQPSLTRLLSRQGSNLPEGESAVAALRDDGHDTGRDPRRRRHQVSSTLSPHLRWAGASHRPLPITDAFAPGGGSSSQTSSPRNTMPLTRLPSVSTARKTLAEPRETRAGGGDSAGPRAGGVDRHGAVAQAHPHPVDPLPARALSADRGRRCAHGLELGHRGVWGGAPASR